MSRATASAHSLLKEREREKQTEGRSECMKEGY